MTISHQRKLWMHVRPRAAGRHSLPSHAHGDSCAQPTLQADLQAARRLLRGSHELCLWAKGVQMVATRKIFSGGFDASHTQQRVSGMLKEAEFRSIFKESVCCNNRWVVCRVASPLDSRRCWKIVGQECCGRVQAEKDPDSVCFIRRFYKWLLKYLKRYLREGWGGTSWARYSWVPIWTSEMAQVAHGEGDWDLSPAAPSCGDPLICTWAANNPDFKAASFKKSQNCHLVLRFKSF